jgi:hypothetical protein
MTPSPGTPPGRDVDGVLGVRELGQDAAQRGDGVRLVRAWPGPGCRRPLVAPFALWLLVLGVAGCAQTIAHCMPKHTRVCHSGAPATANDSPILSSGRVRTGPIPGWLASCRSGSRVSAPRPPGRYSAAQAATAVSSASSPRGDDYLLGVTDAEQDWLYRLRQPHPGGRHGRRRQARSDNSSGGTVTTPRVPGHCRHWAKRPRRWTGLLRGK